MLTADWAVGWCSSEKLGGCDQINVLRFLPVFQFVGLSCFFASQDFTKLLEHPKHWNTEYQSRDSNVLSLTDPWLSRPEIDNRELGAYVTDREPTRIFPNLSTIFPNGCAIQNVPRTFGSPISRLVVLNRSPTLTFGFLQFCFCW